ncbi:hypothetical protein H0H92_001831 [Tricholoma furcatifolium]|nr:hypothetical protein H0H92_001831 [Tricholoma furcatifolium]
MSRQVVVDDSDSQIQYSGEGWFADQGSENDVGNFGPTYENTLHGTKENGDSFSFSFSGSSITVWGTTALTKIDNGTTWDPSWECFVDNVSIGSTAPFQYPENNWVLCGPSSFSDGQHTLTLKVSTSGNTFWFDYITYVPSPSVSLQSSVIMVQNTDPDVIYGSGWGALGGTANETSTVGSQVKYHAGTGLTWYGFIPTEYPHNEAQASYSIDGGSSSTTFTLNGLPANSATVYNQAFFSTPSLSAGSHSITVTYNGGAGSATPFTLGYILLKNVSIPSTSAPGTTDAGSTAVGGSATGTTSVGSSKSGTSVGATVSGATVGGATTGGASAASATAPGSAGGPSSTSIGTGSLDSNPSPSGSSHSSTPIGAIVGAVVGTLALIAALLFLFWCRRRRRATYVHSQPEFLGTGYSPVQMRSNVEAYGSTSSTGNLNPFPITQARYRDHTPSDDSSEPQDLHAAGQNPTTTSSHSHTLSLDTSEASGYLADNQLQPLRALHKAGTLTQPQIVTSLVHEDSGIRFNPPHSTALVEDVPPMYSAS